MFGAIIKDLYIGKSKMDFIANGKALESTVVFDNILLPTGYSEKLKLPDYGNIGIFTEDNFIVTPLHSTHWFLVTGIPKNEILDNFRLEGVIWSSYYEDSRRGYLFQILPMEQKLKLIYGSD